MKCNVTVEFHGNLKVGLQLNSGQKEKVGTIICKVT